MGFPDAEEEEPKYEHSNPLLMTDRVITHASSLLLEAPAIEDFAVSLDAGHAKTGCCVSIPYMIFPKPKPRIVAVGPMWKLNNLSAQVNNDLADLRNWRYRQFYVLRKGPITALAYISEKGGGHFVLASSSKTKNVKGSIEVLPDIDVKHLEPSATEHISSSTIMYRIAFIQKGGELFPADTAEKVIPTRLYPFFITWKDAEKTTTQLKLATSSVRMREQWITQMTKI